MNPLIMIYLLSVVESIYLEQQLDSIMTMGWDIDTVSEEITITLKCKIAKGYCSVGLRKTMTNCDMFAAFTDSTTVTIEDYWSRNHRTPKTDKAEGGTSDYLLVSSSYDSATGLTASLKRKLSTGDQYDQDIIANINSQICWGYLDRRVGWHEHSEFDSATFAWATSQSNMYFSKSSDDQERHGILMSIAWACSATIGIGVARYFKERWWWFYIHFLCLSFSSIATIITSSQLFADGKYPYENISDDTFLHSRVGMILSSLVIGQMIFGMASSYFKIFTKNTHMTLMMNRAHKFVGYALFISGLYNCWIGWDLYGSIGKAAILIGFLLVILFFGILEGIQRFWWNRESFPKKDLTEMTHIKALDLVKSGKLIMFADELVLDLSQFSLSHPGGSFMIVDCVGEDAGKYMVGCSSFDGNYNPYLHSLKAFSMLKSLAIAKVPAPSSYLNISKPCKSVYMRFVVQDQKPLNNHTFIIYFKSEDYQMNKECESTTWLGKHFMIAYKKGTNLIKRYYSSIFVDILDWAQQLEATNRPEVLRDEGLVKFIYKIYPGGKMTNHLNSLKVGDSIQLRGPLGPGLLLQSLEGNYLALGGGTGLVPYLDLVYMAYKAYGNESSTFKLTLFAFFRTSKDGFALDILEKVSQKVNWLDFQLTTDENSKISEVAKDVKRRVEGGFDLVWICGPSGFNRFYHNLVLSAGMQRNKVILM